jgi:carbon-monoxide dehydrogenase medium subunit
MHDFDFLQPTTVAEASRLLAEFGDEARLMAGGTALMLALRQRMVAPGQVISLARMRPDQGLHGLHYDPVRGLRIGALTRHVDLARSLWVQRHYPSLAYMAGHMANPQVRHQGTLGGNLCYADPATDPPTCLLSLGARVVLASAHGERELPLEDFLVDYYVTALAPDELVREIRVPPPPADGAARYTRFLRTAAEHRPLVNVALAVRRQGMTCVEARLVVGASTPVPTRQRAAEERLRGRLITPDLVAEVAASVAADLPVLSDQRGSAEHRRAMVDVVTRRTLAALFGVPTENPTL